jgi:hypothetical protein
MCITDLRKTLVHDASGRLVADARSLTLDMPRFGEQPTCTCKMYLGVYEPTGATKKVWPVREIKLVEDADFQKLVDITAPMTRETNIFRPSRLRIFKTTPPLPGRIQPFSSCHLSFLFASPFP